MQKKLEIKKKRNFLGQALDFLTPRKPVWWPIVVKFNINRWRNFKPHLKFIFDMKIKSKFTFKIDIWNQIDLHFYLNIVFHLLPSFYWSGLI